MVSYKSIKDFLKKNNILVKNDSNDYIHNNELLNNFDEMIKIINHSLISSINGHGNFIEFVLVYSPSEQVIKYFINKIDNLINCCGIHGSALHAIVLNDKCDKVNDIITYLITEKNISINLKNDKNYTPFELACILEHYNVCEFLIENGANIEIKAFLNACFSGSLNSVNYLISKNCDVNICDNNGNTLIHLLAIKYVQNKDNNILNMMKCLVLNNLNCEKANTYGDTAIHIICEINNCGLIDLLFTKNYNFNIKNNDGCTPLLICLKHGYFKHCMYLLNKYDSIIDDMMHMLKQHSNEHKNMKLNDLEADAIVALRVYIFKNNNLNNKEHEKLVNIIHTKLFVC